MDDFFPLKTERLIIRRFKEDDWRDLYEYLSLSEIYRFEAGEPISEDEAQALALGRSRSEIFQAVELRNTGKIVGHLYFLRMKPEILRTYELGFIFNPAFQNNGYATESSRRLIDFAFAEMSAHRIFARCNPRNIASVKVLEKLGMKKEGRFRKRAFFKRDINGDPLWFDLLEYAVNEDDIMENS